MKVMAVRVTNVNLPKHVFDELCDRLKELRKYAHDYRMVSDFEMSKHPLYWQSGTYYWESTSSNFIIACVESVGSDVADFFEKHSLYGRSVDVELKTYKLEEDEDE